MSQYKKMMTRAGVMQKDVVQAVHRRDPRVDKSLVSKFVNDVVLPRKEQLETICDVLGCDVGDLYDQREIDLAHIPPRTAAGKSVATAAKRKRDRRAALDVYNLTAEIEGAKARRLFDPDAMRKLGVLNKTDFVRQAVDAALARLDEIEAKEKAVTDADASGGGK